MGIMSMNTSPREDKLRWCSLIDGMHPWLYMMRGDTPDDGLSWIVAHDIRWGGLPKTLHYWRTGEFPTWPVESSMNKSNVAQAYSWQFVPGQLESDTEDELLDDKSAWVLTIVNDDFVWRIRMRSIEGQTTLLEIVDKSYPWLVMRWGATPTDKIIWMRITDTRGVGRSFIHYWFELPKIAFAAYPYARHYGPSWKMTGYQEFQQWTERTADMFRRPGGFVAKSVTVAPSSTGMAIAAIDGLDLQARRQLVSHTENESSDDESSDDEYTDVHSMMKIGPWGGTGGTPRDIHQDSKRLESITVRSTDDYGGRINGFSFVYRNYKGDPIHVIPWGSTTKGYEDTIQMATNELVIKVCGNTDKTGVRWLQFKTSTGRKRTYGWPSSRTGKHFNVPLQQGGGGVLGFFGLADDSLVAIGVYVSGRNAFH